MTHHLSKLSRVRAARSHPSTRHCFAAAAPTQIAAARTSTTLAMSMMVALRYLEGRSTRPPEPPASAIPLPALT
jgi:hypothetical protein